MGVGHSHALYVHEHSAVHHLPPETKVLATFMFVLAVAMTPGEALWAFGIYLALEATVLALARIPLRFVAARLLAILPFVVFAFFLPFIGSGDRVEVIGLSLSVEGLWAMWAIMAKATLGATASITLAATTEVPDILKGFTALRLPKVLIAIASFMVRYLEVIAGELGRMRTAMTARGYDPRWLWQARPIAASAGALFIRSYERGERVYEAMLSRGYNGAMPTLIIAKPRPRDWVLALAIPITALVVATWALVVT